MKGIFDRRAEPFHFSPGDHVCALLPIVGSLFQDRFQSPYTVVRQCTEQDYLVASPERRKVHQLYHVHLLKPYYAGSSGPEMWESADVSKPVLLASTVTTLGTFLSYSVHGEVPW